MNREDEYAFFLPMCAYVGEFLFPACKNMIPVQGSAGVRNLSFDCNAQDFKKTVLPKRSNTMSQAANTINPVYIPEELLYPDSDGKPMAENTKQYQYIILIQVGIDSLFASDPDVFVAGDLLWYPYEIEPHTRCAPDVMVVFGRPKGHRGSYKQWKEGGIAPQVVFEILSPGNTDLEMHVKRKNYEKYGVEEYIEYDPDLGTLEIWQRDGQTLQPVIFKDEWTSPRVGVKLKLEADGELSLFHPGGRKFLPPAELDRVLAQERERAEQERERAEQERERAEMLAAKLRELGVDPDSLQK